MHQDRTDHGLSERGEVLAFGGAKPDYIVEHFARRDDAWTPDNPDGYIACCLAENRLMWDLLEPHLTAARRWAEDDVAYDRHVGSAHLRQEVAALMSRLFLGRSFDPEQIAVVSGASSVLEAVFYAICDPGDGVLVPTPSYAGFWLDLETRDQVKIITVDGNSSDGFAITTDHLDEAVASAGRPVPALLLTNPTNPTGEIYSRQQLLEILEWARSRQIHVVLDEIYALSIHGDKEFVSGAALLPDLGQWVHIVWALSKDFAVSGLRIGVLVSENDALRAAVEPLAMWSQTSTATQALVCQMIGDEAWVDAFLAESRHRLRRSYRAVTTVLDSYGIDYVEADAGFFVLVDLRSLLDDSTWEAESRLWRQILSECNVNLTPGSACRIAEPGFMRFVFSWVPMEAALEAAERLGRLAKSIRG